MTGHFRISEKPLGDEEFVPALSVTGDLGDYFIRQAFEGRLQINNAVGRCTVKVVESTLPPGAAIRVDNLTREVVVKWAAYEELIDEINLVPGGDFEEGADSGWSMGPGWSIGTGPDYETDSGVYSARFADVKTKGSNMVGPRVRARVNDYIRLVARVQQGASAKGNAGARAGLLFFDSAGVTLQQQEGNMVSSGSGGAWKDSVAEGGAPADTHSVAAVISAYRTREGYPLWVDNLKWNHQYVVGAAEDEPYFLQLEVTDGLNRTALWSGYIGARPPITWDGTWDSFSIPGPSTNEGYIVPVWVPSLGKYLAHAANDSIPFLGSTDLVTWTTQGGNVDTGAGGKNGLAVSPSGRIVYAARSQFYHSTTTASWVPSGVYGYPDALQWCPGLDMFVAHGRSSNQHLVYRSTDGISWIASNPGINGLGELAYSPELQRLVARSGQGYAYSDDGATWTAVSAPGSGTGTYSIAWCGDRFIDAVVDGNGMIRLYESADGVAWSMLPAMAAAPGTPLLAWVPELKELVIVSGTQVYRYTLGATSLVPGTQALAAAAYGIQYDPHSKQVLVVLQRSSGTNLYATRVSY